MTLLRDPGRRLENPLDPASSLVEIVAAIVIALGVVGSARLGVFGPTDPREIFWVVVACGLAWGFVDAILYLLATTIEYGRLDRLAAELRAGSLVTADERRRAVATVYGSLTEAGPAEELEPAYDALSTALAAPRPRRRLSGGDASAAALVVGWVLLTSLVLGLPLLLPTQDITAYVVTQVWGMLLLGLTGVVWARHTTYRPVIVGLGLAAIGAVLIMITLVLGAV